MRLTTGSHLGPYRILDTLGEGGMGEVYRAHDPRLDRDVALKVLPARLASSEEMLERFRREARAVAAVNHPSIVTIYSVENADGVHFLTMELIEGQSLDRLIPERGLDVERILAMADALCGALAAAHDKGIIHRDLKPANIMVTTEGAVKVLDFGLAKVQGTEAQDDLTTMMHTSAGTVMGTRPYMSPEQVQGRPLDHRTDLFSLGVVLYEMATGRRPFREESSAGLFASILRDAPAPVTDVRADLPDALTYVAQRCLEKDPHDRFQTARDVGAQLRQDARPPSSGARAAVGVGESGFWVAVLPFKFTGASPELTALAEGLTEEIVAGLSRFAYLRVLTKGTSGARYVLEGSLRQAGGQVRVAVKLIDSSTGANLWAENYARPFSPNTVFETQDSLVPTIVSTIAETNGVLAHSMWVALRDRDPETLTPYEAMLRSFGYNEHLTPDEHHLALVGLKRAIGRQPNHAGCLAMLAIVYADGYLLGYSTEENPAEQAVFYGRRAVAAEPSDHFAHYGLAFAHMARKDIPAFHSAAERALALNPLDGGAIAGIAMFTAFVGEWQRGCELMQRAMTLNPRHPGWYWFPFVADAYRQQAYSRALDYALRLNLPGFFHTHIWLAAVHAQLGNRDEAAHALRELDALYPDFGSRARQELEKWIVEPEFVEHWLEGLRKAGLKLAEDKA